MHELGVWGVWGSVGGVCVKDCVHEGCGEWGSVGECVCASVYAACIYLLLKKNMESHDSKETEVVRHVLLLVGEVGGEEGRRGGGEEGRRGGGEEGRRGEVEGRRGRRGGGEERWRGGEERWRGGEVEGKRGGGAEGRGGGEERWRGGEWLAKEVRHGTGPRCFG